MTHILFSKKNKECPEYRKFVTTHPCCIDNHKVESWELPFTYTITPHHTVKKDDFSCVPLCLYHHRIIHDYHIAKFIDRTDRNPNDIFPRIIKQLNKEWENE